MEEIWKTVEEAPAYMVSNLGRVRSHRVYSEGLVLKPKSDKDGYLTLSLVINDPKSVIWRRVHRLVAIAFIPNPESLPLVNHLDGNVQNNAVSNLEWADNSRNQLHRFHVLGQTWDATRRGRYYTFTHIKATNTLSNEEWEFDCVNDCARFFGVDDCCIHNRLRGRARNPSNSPRSKINGIFFEVNEHKETQTTIPQANIASGVGPV